MMMIMITSGHMVEWKEQCKELGQSQSVTQCNTSQEYMYVCMYVCM